MDHSLRAAAFLGIECGGTHSVALLVPNNGQPSTRAEFGPANIRLLSDIALAEHFAAMKTIQTADAPALAGIVIGAAGARTESDRQRIRAAAAKIWPNTPCYATNDLEPALAAAESAGATKNITRVLIVSGTGSCCFGRTPDKRTLRVGGWGHIIGDKGSGYEIGLRALKAVVHYLDRDGAWTILGQGILHALHLNEPNDLIDWAKGADKSDIAALAVQVFAAAARRDKIARDILEAAAEKLADDALACARRLVKKSEPVEFILSGSVLLKQPAFARKVRARLIQLWPKAMVTPLRRESIWGAIELAREHFDGGLNAPPAGRELIVQHRAMDLTPIPISRGLSPTEQRNPRSAKLDQLPLSKAVTLMLAEESKIFSALHKERRHIEHAIELIVSSFRRGGRLFYCGAGTSGRLGVLDASECPPTFHTPPDRVQGIIAGGQKAIWLSVEGAEDDTVAGAAAIEYRGVNKRDVVVGIAASGRTPFVWAALAAAKKRGAKTVLLAFNPHLEIPEPSRPDVVISPSVGPEVLTGSTRLKAGTATKIVLNILTTLSMVRMGKVISNLMVDLKASNRKLRERAVRIVQAITGADAVTAETALEKSRWVVKTACLRLR